MLVCGSFYRLSTHVLQVLYIKLSSPLEIRGLLQKYSNYMHLVIWDGALSVNFTFGCYSFRCGNNQNENQCRKNHCFGKPQILCALPLQYIQDPSIFPGRHNMRAWPLCTSWRVVLRGCIPKCVFNGIPSPLTRQTQAQAKQFAPGDLLFSLGIRVGHFEFAKRAQFLVCRF